MDVVEAYALIGPSEVTSVPAILPAPRIFFTAHPLHHDLRPWLPKRRHRRIAHVLREVTGPMKTTSIPSTASSASMSSIALGILIVAAVSRFS
jgi:hypothetical protein